MLFEQKQTGKKKSLNSNKRNYHADLEQLAYGIKGPSKIVKIIQLKVAQLTYTTDKTSNNYRQTKQQTERISILITNKMQQRSTNPF